MSTRSNLPRTEQKNLIEIVEVIVREVAARGAR